MRQNPTVRMNALGRAAMNQPSRALAQRWFVAALWERMGGRDEGAVALEVGCGRGAGLQIILNLFGARRARGFDLDPVMVRKAQRRWAGVPHVEVSLGDATDIDAPDASYDAVFDFGAIHLIARWPVVVAEVRRVLKPGGRFYFEEIAGRGYRSLLPIFTAGPPDPRATGFTREAFIGELETVGIRVGGRVRTPRAMPLTGVVGDLIGVGRVEG